MQAANLILATSALDVFQSIKSMNSGGVVKLLYFLNGYFPTYLMGKLKL